MAATRAAEMPGPGRVAESRAAVAGRRLVVRAQRAGVGAGERQQSRQPQVLAAARSSRHPEVRPGGLETALPGVDRGEGEMQADVQVRMSGHGRRSRALVDQAGRDPLHAHDVRQLADEVEADPTRRARGRRPPGPPPPRADTGSGCAPARPARPRPRRAPRGSGPESPVQGVRRTEDAPGCVRCCRAVARPLQNLGGRREVAGPRPGPRCRFHPFQDCAARTGSGRAPSEPERDRMGWVARASARRSGRSSTPGPEMPAVVRQRPVRASTPMYKRTPGPGCAGPGRE